MNTRHRFGLVVAALGLALLAPAVPAQAHGEKNKQLSHSLWDEYLGDTMLFSSNGWRIETNACGTPVLRWNTVGRGACLLFKLNRAFTNARAGRLPTSLPLCPRRNPI